jgi:DNA-binding transcriptional regulator/RsmH inhibitor MraZ
MLGDVDVFGRFDVTIDDKNIMILPAKTKVEAGEEVLIVSKAGAKYIVSRKFFDEYIEAIRKQIYNPLNKRDFIELLELYESLCEMVIKQVKVDKQHRILVTDLYQPKGKGQIMGMGKMLKLINVTEEAPEEEQNKKR